MECRSQKRHKLQLSYFQYFPVNFMVPLCIMFGRDLVVGGFFSFEGGNIAAVNCVSVENVLNADREIIYGAYHMLEGFLWGVAKH